MVYDLIIIGAGAAGLFAAASVEPGQRVLVLEKGPTAGKKLLLAGSGQCNLTHDGPIKSFLGHYGAAGKRLRPVLFPFSNLALMEAMEALGVPLTVREDGKVFPASMDGHQVLDALLLSARRRGVELRYNSPVTELTALPEGSPGRFTLRADGHYMARNVLVATGGASYPQTGSDGGFFPCLEALGVPVTPLHPALVPLYVEGYPYAELSGISFPDCTVSTPAATGRGGLLLTHRCLSGPVILDLSRHVRQGDELVISYLPGREAGQLRKALLSAFTGEKRQLLTALENATGLPRRFLDTVCRRVAIPPDTKASRLSGEEVRRLAELLTGDRLRVSGTMGFGAAMATAGGVSLDAVELGTMSSRDHPGLYFAGEALDVDGDTGGYNLQFAFSSAHLAAQLR